MLKRKKKKFFNCFEIKIILLMASQPQIWEYGIDRIYLSKVNIFKIYFRNKNDKLNIEHKNYRQFFCLKTIGKI